MKKKFIVLSLTSVILISLFSTSAFAATKRISYYRGSVLAWSRDHVEWEYNGSKVLGSSGWQETGWIFPNIVRKKGISRYSTSNTQHNWKATKTISAGVPTPWGDVTLVSKDYTDYIYVRYNGTYQVN